LTKGQNYILRSTCVTGNNTISMLHLQLSKMLT